MVIKCGGYERIHLTKQLTMGRPSFIKILALPSVSIWIYFDGSDQILVQIANITTHWFEEPKVQSDLVVAPQEVKGDLNTSVKTGWTTSIISL